MSDEESKAHDEAIVDQAVIALMKHFDAVQVFVTRQDGQKTMSCCRGKGNWYARVGLISEWFDAPSVSEEEPEELDE